MIFKVSYKDGNGTRRFGFISASSEINAKAKAGRSGKVSTVISVTKPGKGDERFFKEFSLDSVSSMTIDDIKQKYLFDAIDESEKQAIAELKKRAPGLLRMINGELKRLNAKAQFEMPSDKALYSDGWHINLKLKTLGKNDKLGDILRGINGMRRLGVIFKLNDHAIYLERSWRPTSNRSVVVNPLSRK